MEWGLRSGITFCAIEDAWFFLDLPGDRYSCLVGAAARRFGACVDDTVSRSLEAFAPLAGMIEAGAARPVPFRLVTPPAADHAGTAPSSPLSLRLAAIAALGTAILIVGRRPLARSVDRLRDRKALIVERDRHGRVAEVAHAFAFAGATLGVQDRCLPLSLACAHVLAGQNIRSELIFGVRDRPFEAHCWVQVGACVVNDTLERVCGFTPILAV